jgi:hypothetical protein
MSYLWGGRFVEGGMSMILLIYAGYIRRACTFGAGRDAWCLGPRLFVLLSIYLIYFLGQMGEEGLVERENSVEGGTMMCVDRELILKLKVCFLRLNGNM